MADTGIPYGGGNIISGLTLVKPKSSNGGLSLYGGNIPYPSTDYGVATWQLPSGYDTSKGFILLFKITQNNITGDSTNDQFPSLFLPRANAKVQIYDAGEFVINGRWDGGSQIKVTVDRTGSEGFTFGGIIGYIFFK